MSDRYEAGSVCPECGRTVYIARESVVFTTFDSIGPDGLIDNEAPSTCPYQTEDLDRDAEVRCLGCHTTWSVDEFFEKKAAPAPKPSTFPICRVRIDMMTSDGSVYAPVAATEYVLSDVKFSQTRDILKLVDEKGRSHFLDGKNTAFSLSGIVLESTPKRVNGNVGMGAEVKHG